MATENKKESAEPQPITGNGEESEPRGVKKFMKSGEVRDLIIERFKPHVVKEIMANVMKENLKDKAYEAEEVAAWTQQIADQIKDKVKGQGLERYKIVVKIHLVQLKGQGLKMNFKAVWDATTDYFVYENYFSDVECNGFLLVNEDDCMYSHLLRNFRLLMNRQEEL